MQQEHSKGKSAVGKGRNNKGKGYRVSSYCFIVVVNMYVGTEAEGRGEKDREKKGKKQGIKCVVKFIQGLYGDCLRVYKWPGLRTKERIVCAGK